MTSSILEVFGFGHLKTSPSWGEVPFLCPKILTAQGLRLLQNAQLKNVENPFIKGEEPAATLGSLIQSRNHLVHNKPKYEPVKRLQNSIVSAMNYYLRKDLIENLDKKVRLIIEIICEKIGIGVPGWLNNPSLWSQHGSV